MTLREFHKVFSSSHLLLYFSFNMLILDKFFPLILIKFSWVTFEQFSQQLKDANRSPLSSGKSNAEPWGQSSGSDQGQHRFGSVCWAQRKDYHTTRVPLHIKSFPTSKGHHFHALPNAHFPPHQSCIVWFLQEAKAYASTLAACILLFSPISSLKIIF